jgi:predicted nucleic acid-binding protein
MAYLLDSNVVSELWKSEPGAEVTAWRQASEWFVPVVVIAEEPSLVGLGGKARSRRRETGVRSYAKRESVAIRGRKVRSVAEDAF